MGDHLDDGPGLTIRPGGPADHAYVIALGAEAFARFGDYAPVMTEFLQSPNVVSFIACLAGEPVGFALVETSADEPALADLVAIAVDHRHRHKGVGRALLTRVITASGERGDPAVIILTVADDNFAAIELFRSCGFELVPGSLGRYAGGQISRRMIRAV